MTGGQLWTIVATALSALAMWLLLPPGPVRRRMAGALVGAVALECWAAQLPALGDWVSHVIFYVLAGVTVVAAAAAVSFRNPVYCAVWFGLMLLGTAGLLLVVGAQFLAVATVVVYAGAILVTFLFVLMLAQPEGRAAYDRAGWEPLLAAVVGTVLVGMLSLAVAGVLSAGSGQPPITPPTEKQLAQNILASDHVARLGEELFGRHLVAVEVAGTLLLAALVGAAVIIAQARAPTRKPAAAATGPDPEPPRPQSGGVPMNSEF